MKPILIFHNHLRDSSNLLEGRLLLISAITSKVLNVYKATSGLPNYQNPDETDEKSKGSIPETIDIGKTYQVDTAPISLPNVKGVEGNFYRILPFTVTVDGVERGDFGIHRDANVPGSSGCVVLTTANGWSAFEKDMNDLASGGINQIPLIVSYSKN